GYESAQQERDAARAKLNEVLPELAELRAREARRDAEVERLAAEKANLQTQLDAARCQLYQCSLNGRKTRVTFRSGRSVRGARGTRRSTAAETATIAALVMPSTNPTHGRRVEADRLAI